MGSKLIISGLTEAERRRFDELCAAVQEAIPEPVRRSFDRSTVGRYILNQAIERYEKSPKDLAIALGFTATL